MKIIIPDDYQNVIQTLACFQLFDGFEVQVYHDTVTDLDELAGRFVEAEAIVLTRERTRHNVAQCPSPLYRDQSSKYDRPAYFRASKTCSNLFKS